MKMLDKATTEKAVKFLGKESIFCVMKGILKKPFVGKNGSDQKYYSFNLRVTGKDGYGQTFNCIIPSTIAAQFKDEEFALMKDKEVLIIPQLQNQVNEWKSEETGKEGVSNRLTLYVTRIAELGEGESNKVYDDTLAVNW